jgi:RimJ/RimL family protein N-acetyltransferase
MLSGRRVTLRAPQPGDVADRLAAGRDPEFRRMVGATDPSPAPLTLAEAERWYAELLREPCGWIIEHAGRCIGVARLHGIEAAARRVHLAVGIFAPEHRGRGLGGEVVALLLVYAFGPLGMAEVHLRVLAFNTRAIACYRRCGFREVGREAVTIGAERAEDVLMVLTVAEFEPARTATAARAPRPSR